jgi:hypothetical protein
MLLASADEVIGRGFAFVVARLAQDVGDVPGAIEIRALPDLDFSTVGPVSS